MKGGKLSKTWDIGRTNLIFDFLEDQKTKKRGWPDEDDFSWNQILFELHIDYKIALEILDCQSYDQYIINSSNPISLKIFMVWKSDCDSAIKFILSAW